MTIRLLVSVRNGAEAEIAVRAGADIIDVKEPLNGPLGFAGSSVLEDVVAAVDRRVPISAALGECSDWADFSSTDNAVPALPDGLLYAKLGLSGLASSYPDEDQSWPAESWSAVREQFFRARAGSPWAWVAVAYADHKDANAPSPESTLLSAANTGCSVLLVDTFLKNGRSTFDCLSEAALVQLQHATNEAGLQFALAGRIERRHLPMVRRIRPDIVGVRGAVCDMGDRESEICCQQVQRFVESLHSH